MAQGREPGSPAAPRPTCGRCGATLRSASRVVLVTDADFDDEVLGARLPVLLEVWAPWCVPCRGLDSVIDDLAASLAGRVRVARLELDHSPMVAARLGIDGVPTLILFKGGQEVTRMVGARTKSHLLRAIAGVA